ncbi:hypothetical protein GCM10027299_09380 [Larkinella ripae]
MMKYKLLLVLLLYAGFVDAQTRPRPGLVLPGSSSEISGDSSRASSTGKYRLFLRSGTLRAKPRTGLSFALIGGGGGGGGPAIWSEIIDRPGYFPPLFAGALQDSLNARTRLSTFNAYMASVTSALAGKQNTLTAGTDYLQPSGSGSQLTNLNADNLGSGTIPDPRLSTNVPLKGSSVGWTAQHTFTLVPTVAGIPFLLSNGSGASLTSLNPAAIQWNSTYATVSQAEKNLITPNTRTLAGLDLTINRTALELRTALGLVIGSTVLAPNGNGAGLTGIVPTTRTFAGLDFSTNRSSVDVRTALNMGSIYASNLSTSDADSNNTIPDMARLKRTVANSTGADLPYDNRYFRVEVNESGDTVFVLAPTTVTPGSYTLASVTVDDRGRVTAIASGSAPSGGGTFATQSEAETGTSPNTYMSPLRSKQSFIADLANNLTTTNANKALDARQGKVLGDGLTSLANTVATKQDQLISGTTLKTIGGVSLLGPGDIPSVGGGGSTNLAVLQKSFGILIPAFRTANKFDNIGGSLSSPQLTVHASGTGLVSGTGGSNADGYLKLPQEITARSTTRTDWRISFDMTESGSPAITVGVGEAANGYMITLAKSGSNLVVTQPSGATVTGALSGTVNISVSIATANGGVTSSVQVLGTPTSLTSTSNPLRVPVFEWARLTKNRQWYAYFKTNTTSSRIVGFLHNQAGWDGDPTGQLLTRTMVVNAVGAIGNSSTLDPDHESMIILPERSSLTTAQRVVQYFHHKGGFYNTILSTSVLDAGETARQILLAGYALIATTGGMSTNTLAETENWGNPEAVGKASEVFEKLQANVRNLGKEYLLGTSMGGGWALNYTRRNPERIGAIWLSCPAVNFEETGTGSIQANSGLKQSLDLAYSSWYISLVASNTADPQTDGGTNWRQVSSPGALPELGVRLATQTTVNGAVSNSATVVLAATTKVFAGDWVYFKLAGQLRQVTHTSAASTSIFLDAPVTLVTGDLVSVLREPATNSVGYEFNWVQRNRNVQWTAGTYGAGGFRKRASAVPELDIRPHNPARYADFYASLNVPITIMVPTGGSSANDGILNLAPMYQFRDDVNALRTGLVTLVVGTSAAHLAAGTFKATGTNGTVDTFNAN